MGKVSIEICCGLHCSLKGGQELLEFAESDQLLDDKDIDILPVNCLKCCNDGDLAPVVAINGICYDRMTTERFVSTLRMFIR
jgi:NADH:ubiquinone oxidoreductase subunit E